MAVLQNNAGFYRDKRVMVTGHTGFKGSWLCLCLKELGAKVYGFSLPPPENGLFERADISRLLEESLYGDIGDFETLNKALERIRPDFIFHLAAQSSVREGLAHPLDTYRTNLMGTANLLEGVRLGGFPCTVVLVTSDKCYLNLEQETGYAEDARLGGVEPYAGSKACCELLAETFRHSYFPEDEYGRHGVALATARSCNLIGGGDMQFDRLLPSILQSLIRGEKITLRSPDSIRPWQHVLDSLSGYLLLGERLHTRPRDFSRPYNFGPRPEDVRRVKEIAETVCRLWGRPARVEISPESAVKESRLLMIDSGRARSQLGWKQVWDIEKALKYTLESYQGLAEGQNLQTLCIQDIRRYSADFAAISDR